MTCEGRITPSPFPARGLPRKETTDPQMASAKLATRLFYQPRQIAAGNKDDLLDEFRTLAIRADPSPSKPPGSTTSVNGDRLEYSTPMLPVPMQK